MCCLLDLRPLVVEHEDRVVGNELVSFRLARHHFVQGAVDVLHHEVDGIRRQVRSAEQDIEDAVVGVHRQAVIEMPLIAPPEGGAERKERVGGKHERERDADRLEQRAERAFLDDLLAASAACPLGLGRSKLRARGQRDRPKPVVCIHDETGALTFGHVVQHGSNVLAQY